MLWEALTSSWCVWLFDNSEGTAKMSESSNGNGNRELPLISIEPLCVLSIEYEDEEPGRVGMLTNKYTPSIGEFDPVDICTA